MAKEESTRLMLLRQSRASAPYPATRGLQVNSCDAGRDWEDAICPICKNPPHKAVLLLCSSCEDGCRPYICDTSYRHSNCLDQFMKMGARVELNRHERPNLACPLCRGQVKGLTVVQGSRIHLDTKTRSCAHESCPFSGTYAQLKKHARLNHPFARPTEVDPIRQRNWQRLEEESNIGDVLSSIQSTMPGAFVFGDYVIEDDDITDGFDDSDFSADEG